MALGRNLAASGVAGDGSCPLLTPLLSFLTPRLAVAVFLNFSPCHVIFDVYFNEIPLRAVPVCEAYIHICLLINPSGLTVMGTHCAPHLGIGLS